MPGKHITEAQKSLFWELVAAKIPVVTASVKAGFSRSSGYRLINADSESPSEPVFRSNRRPDPLNGAFEEIGIPMLERDPKTRAVAVVRKILAQRNDVTWAQRRTIERRVARWKEDHGKRKAPHFPRDHPWGREAQVDFTKMSGVTIAGQPFAHILFQYRLVASGWVWLDVVEGGETFEALARGIDAAAWHCGGVPEVLCTDNLPAAYRNQERDAWDATFQFADLCSHYGVLTRRTNRASPHENGSVESSNRHRCAEVEDALSERGSRDFTDLDEYKGFIRAVVDGHNQRYSDRFLMELPVLGKLPLRKYTDFTDHRITVDKLNGFTLAGVTYTLPPEARLGKLTARVRYDRIEVFRAGRLVAELPRRIAAGGGGVHWAVDYRHVLDDLKRKPGILLDLAYRDDLFPDPAFLETFLWSLESMPGREACRLAVGLLDLAWKYDCDDRLAGLLRECLDRAELPSLDDLTAKIAGWGLPLFHYIDNGRNPTLPPPFHPRLTFQLDSLTLVMSVSDAPPTYRFAANGNSPYRTGGRPDRPPPRRHTGANDNRAAPGGNPGEVDK